jgi:hypothetical protein
MRCHDCPVATGLTCYAESRDLCKLVGNPGMARHIRSMSGDTTDATVTRETVIPLAESLRLLAARKACPHFTPDGGACGCNGHCAVGKGRDGKVNRDECYACLRLATPA